jgi:hypothetical protein
MPGRRARELGAVWPHESSPATVLGAEGNSGFAASTMNVQLLLKQQQ